jgi:hypothetical protein
MQAIQMIMQRMMWASCFCVALTWYHAPTRALPIKLGAAPELHSGNRTTYLAEQLGTEVGGMIEFQSAYVLTRALNQGCRGNQCHQTRMKQPMLKPSSLHSNEGLIQSLIEPAQSESIR